MRKHVDGFKNVFKSENLELPYACNVICKPVLLIIEMELNLELN